MKIGKELVATIWKKSNHKYPKSKQLQFIKKDQWILPHLGSGMPIPESPSYYSDANKLGMAGNQKKQFTAHVRQFKSQSFMQFLQF